ncbi:MAG: hypothetical protein GXZ11_03040 [Tissierellia bacterium]|nr:hypothetical protein [Tissierellia bacterium]
MKKYFALLLVAILCLSGCRAKKAWDELNDSIEETAKGVEEIAKEFESTLEEGLDELEASKEELQRLLEEQEKSTKEDIDSNKDKSIKESESSDSSTDVEDIQKTAIKLYTSDFNGQSGAIPVGETIEKEGLSVILGVLRFNAEPDSSHQPEDGYIYFNTVFDITNNMTDDKRIYISFNQVQLTVDGKLYKDNVYATSSYNNDDALPLADYYKPGETINSQVGFEIPVNWNEIIVTLKSVEGPSKDIPMNIKFEITRDSEDPTVVYLMRAQ